MQELLNMQRERMKQSQKIYSSVANSKLNGKAYAKAAAYRIDAHKVSELSQKANSLRSKGENVSDKLWDDIREAQYRRGFSADRVEQDDKAKPYIDNLKTLKVHAKEASLSEAERQPSFVPKSRRMGTLDKLEKEYSSNFIRTQSSYVSNDLKRVKKSKGELSKSIMQDKEAQKEFSQNDLEKIAKTARRFEEKEHVKEHSLER